MARTAREGWMSAETAIDMAWLSLEVEMDVRLDEMKQKKTPAPLTRSGRF
jgi:hypothetical protein